jgi:hypothetical protein
MMRAIRGQPNRGLRDLSSTVKREERRRAEGDRDLSDASWTGEEPPESAPQSVAPQQVRRPLARPAQNEQLLLEQEILRDHRSHAAGATELRGHHGHVQQGEQEVPHARVSVGQTSSATQRCPILDSAPELAIRELHAAEASATPGSIILPCRNVGEAQA